MNILFFKDIYKWLEDIGEQMKEFVVDHGDNPLFWAFLIIGFFSIITFAAQSLRKDIS